MIAIHVNFVALRAGRRRSSQLSRGTEHAFSVRIFKYRVLVDRIGKQSVTAKWSNQHHFSGAPHLEQTVGGES